MCVCGGLYGCHIIIYGSKSARWFSLSLHKREVLSTYHNATKCQRVGKKHIAATQPFHSSHTHVSAAPVAKIPKVEISLPIETFLLH